MTRQEAMRHFCESNAPTAAETEEEGTPEL